MSSGYNWLGEYSETEIKDGYISTNSIFVNSSTNVHSINISPQQISFSAPSGTSTITTMWFDGLYGSINCNTITTGDNFSVNQDGEILCTHINNGVPLTNMNYTFWCAQADHAHGTLFASSDKNHISAYFSESGNFVSTSAGDLGTSTNRWDGAWLSAGYSTTSDRNLKNTINPLSDIYYELLKRLIPSSFKYNDGTSDRLHSGFISQDVESALQEIGLPTSDFAGFIKAPIYEKYDEEGEPDKTSPIVDYRYFLRYEEFIAINTYAIQKQELKIQELENRILKLESV
jgi:hypothetical protein